MDRITKFPLLDETGQEIVNSLEEINNSMGDYIASNNPYYAYLEDRKIGTLVSTEITKVRYRALYKRESLISIDLPRCTTVGNFAFNHCEKLSNVNLPECVKVGQRSFLGCTVLSKIIFQKIERMAAGAFEECSNLETLIIKNDTKVCVIGKELRTNSLAGTKIESGNGYIYVPDKLVQQYKTAYGWDEYANQIKPLSEYTE